MLLPAGGADVWYADESADRHCFALVAFAVPLLRNTGPNWQISWPDHFDAMKRFRTSLRATHHVPIRKELHGVKLASGRGRYAKGKHQLGRPQAASVYRWILS